MNRTELKYKLIGAGIKENSYDLFGGNLDNVYCIEEEGKKWIVFFRERGERIWKKQFSDENEACEFMLEEMLDDPPIRK